MLALAMTGILASVVLLLWLHSNRHLPQVNTGGAAERAPQVSPGVMRLFPWIISGVVLLLTLGVYSQTGRFHDWDTGHVNQHINYLVAADITKGRRAVEQTPDNEVALLDLAQSYAAGGLYQDAVTTLNQLISLNGESAELLGMKATAMYYRDERAIAPETGIVIARALALHREELQTRLLLATDAYLRGEYSKAIEHWTILLQNREQPVNRHSIENAIAKAQAKLGTS
ncbi:tetratricopeptide repeat protein [Shewanella sp. NIFS-20-20]|uniref:tetratricopeptide repeat protein n=1 Tax=Shewanella sp. NIFS-20-20 TaxID=2853806 RepID=UPI001C44D44D|nr:tetratricopeptide repeat protein [Shewanella sp. NIFS-20-20]MBV7316970.1 nitrite reductase [Shewanella sp. NIFS-20-20]